MTPSHFLSSTVPAAPSGLPASGLHRGAVRVRTRGVALVLSLAAVCYAECGFFRFGFGQC